MKPKLFIGSSVESRNIAYAIQENLDYDAECTVWPQGVFQLSQTALDSLLNLVNSSDYAIFVFGPDDITQIRNQSKSTVRDNVIFETGLFIGGIGTDRVYFVIPSESDNLHLPTDLLGITPGRFDSTRKDLTAALGAFCNQVRKRIEEFGTKDTFEVIGTKDVKNTETDDFIYTDEHKELDKTTCLNIKEILPVDGSISFIKNHNFANAYKREAINDLKVFLFDSNNVTFEFINQDLEKLRMSLLESINKLISLLGKNTWVSKSNHEYSSIPIEWEEDQPERYNQVLDSIHETCDSIYTMYSDLIRLSKRILAV